MELLQIKLTNTSIARAQYLTSAVGRSSERIRQRENKEREQNQRQRGAALTVHPKSSFSADYSGWG